MSEQFPTSHENHEALPTAERYEALPTPEQAEPLRKGEKDPVQALAESRATVAEIARPAQQEKLHSTEQPAAPAPKVLSRDLMNSFRNREFITIRRKLNRRDRAASKVIHQPIVRAVSETAGKTVSRPSGLLGGGILAFIGSTGYLYLAKHMGFKYNASVFLVLFAGGFVLGLLIELIVSYWARTHSS